ncbi:hypothetical protein AB205_0003910, partial [Aquarana catesbeiana]
GSSNGNPPERCPRLLYSRDSIQEDHTIPHHHQGEELKDIKVEDKEEEEERLVSGDQQSMEEREMTMESKQEESSLHMDTNDHNVRNTSEESSDKSHSRTLRSHSRNTLIDPSIPEESSSGQEGDHTEESSLSCSVCGKLFTKKRELLKHKKYHTAERPYSCSECGKCFISKGQLLEHQTIHTGERRYSCSECGKRFVRKGQLLEHQKIHTGERPFSCSECGKCFARKQRLLTHQTIHT